MKARFKGGFMKILLWEIHLEPNRLAKIQWFLFKVFGIKQKKNPCGHTKHARGYYCHQPYKFKYCDVINEDKKHEVVCKCCGHTRMSSSHYIDPNNDDNWLGEW